jgi:hypothetical protein
MLVPAKAVSATRRIEDWGADAAIVAMHCSPTVRECCSGRSFWDQGDKATPAHVQHSKEAFKLSLNHAASYRLRNLLVAHPGYFAQYLLVVFTEQRRVAIWTCLISRDAELITGVGDSAHLGMLVEAVEFPVRILRVATQIAAALERTCGHTVGCELIHCRMRRAGASPLGQMPVDLVVRFESAGQRIERRIPSPLRITQRFSE